MVFVFDANATPTKGVNSYVTDTEVVGYATSHNFSADARTVDKVRPFIFRAMDFIESYRHRFQGRKTLATQPLQWPRQGVVIDGSPVAEDFIPDEIREAVAICAVEMVAGYDPNKPLSPKKDAKTMSSVSILGSSISERYLVDWGLADVLPHVEALLRPLLRDDADDVLVRN